jgi:mannose-6-phosphate isomerase-like protein (cupin superfamily)
MILVDTQHAFGYRTPPPHVRELKVLLSPELQKGVERLSVGMTILPPGESSSYHSHANECETWIVVAGFGEVVVDDERQAVGPESVVFLPPGSRHQAVNIGQETFRMFWIYTPPGAEKAVLEKTAR